MVYDSYNQLFLLGWSNFQMIMTSMLVCVGVSMSFWLWAIIVPTAIALDLQFLCWACFCLFDFVLELVGFVFRFEDFLVLCCDCVQHNVLCNESEFSTVCVIQTVGSLVTRQGLNCFFVCQHSWTTFGTLYIQMPCYYVPCTNISLSSIFICLNFGTSHSGSNDDTFLSC